MQTVPVMAGCESCDRLECGTVWNNVTCLEKIQRDTLGSENIEHMSLKGS